MEHNDQDLLSETGTNIESFLARLYITTLFCKIANDIAIDNNSNHTEN